MLIHMGEKLGDNPQAPRPSGPPKDAETYKAPGAESAPVPMHWVPHSFLAQVPGGKVGKDRDDAQALKTLVGAGASRQNLTSSNSAVSFCRRVCSSSRVASVRSSCVFNCMEIPQMGLERLTEAPLGRLKLQAPPSSCF